MQIPANKNVKKKIQKSSHSPTSLSPVCKLYCLNSLAVSKLIFLLSLPSPLDLTEAQENLIEHPINTRCQITKLEAKSTSVTIHEWTLKTKVKYHKEYQMGFSLKKLTSTISS